MRIIDKTPYLEEDGSISIVNRIQGTLQNGFSWYGNLQAQDRAIAFFEKQLDKKFTLIRNLTLGTSKITIPFILIGPPGAYVFMVTNLKGTYRAKGSNWGEVDGEKYKEASVNLMKRTMLFAKAVTTYLQKQGLELPQPIEPILLALNPGIHIETVRPAVRIVMSDAIERFAAGLHQAPPTITVGDVHQVSEAIVNPIRKKSTAPAPMSQPEQEEPEETPIYDPYGQDTEYFQQEEEPASSDGFGEIGFSFNDEEEAPAEEEFAPVVPEMEPARPRPAAKKPRRKAAKNTALFGMTTKQLIILAAMAGFVALMLIVVIIFAFLSL